MSDSTEVTTVATTANTPAPSKLPFCIVSIARNEQDLMPRFCDSIVKAFGKIGEAIDLILVDTGSTDHTRDIAREYGAIVIEAGDRFAHYYKRNEVRRVNQEIGQDVIKVDQRIFDFAAARNCANDNATSDWCLSLDICDIVERAVPSRIVSAINAANAVNKMALESLAKLQEQLKNTPAEARAALNQKIAETQAKVIWGYTFRLRYGALEHQTPLEQSTSKLFNRNLPGGLWRCITHEVYSADGSARILPKDVEGRDSLVVRHAQRLEAVHNYLGGLAYGYLVQPPPSIHDQARLLYYFARELYYRGLYGNVSGTSGAKKYLNKVCESRLNWIKERSAAACHLAECYDVKLPGTMELRRKAYIRAVNLYPGWREPYIKLACLAWEQDDFAGCAAWGEAALKVSKPTDVLFAENGSNYTTEGYRLLYIGYTRLANKYVEAGIDCREVLQRALDVEDLDGCDAKVHVFGWKLAYTHWIKHDFAKAKAYFDRCYVFDSKSFEQDKHYFYN